MKDNDLQRIWGNGPIRVFISHTHPHQAMAAQLQGALSKLGIASFVAHKDIEPTRQWEDEIISALQTMHVLAALLTPDFKNSDWTDHEVGAAVGRAVPVFPINLGLLPYGFMKRFQAIPGVPGESGGDLKVSRSIFDAILSDTRLEHLAVDAYIAAVQNSRSYRQTDGLVSSWNRIGNLMDHQVQALLTAYNTNNQVSGAGTFDEIILKLMRQHTGVQHQFDFIGGHGKQCVPVY